MSKKRKGSSMASLSSAIGGIVVGLDEQLLRNTPRIEVLVKRGQTVRGASSEGGDLVIGMPDDPIVLGDGLEATDRRGNHLCVRR